MRHDPLQRRIEFLRIRRLAVRSDCGHTEGRRLLWGDIALGRLDPDVERVGVERNLHRLRNPPAAVLHDADEEQKVEHRRRIDVGLDFVFRRRRPVGIQASLSERIRIGFKLPFPVSEGEGAPSVRLERARQEADFTLPGEAGSGSAEEIARLDGERDRPPGHQRGDLRGQRDFEARGGEFLDVERA